ncbi:MAG: hypothetical protein ACLTKI_02080 [Lachnospiraceae bacterium]
MNFGWFQDTDGTWYYLHEISDGRLGTMETGWHYDAQEHKWYYLDPETGGLVPNRQRD